MPAAWWTARKRSSSATLLAADALLCLQENKAAGDSLGSLRLVETRTGVRLCELLTSFGDQPDQWAAPWLEEWRRAKAVLELPPDARRYVGVIGIQSEEPGSALTSLGRALSVFLEHDLGRLPGVVVLEREHLRLLRQEQQLTGVELELRSSAWLIEGGLRRNEAGSGCQVTVKLLSLGGHAPQAFELTLPNRDLVEIRREVARKVAENWNQTVTEVVRIAPQTEAAAFARRREWYRSTARREEAARMADVAVILDPSRDNLLAARHIHAALAEPPANRAKEAFRAAQRTHELDIEYLRGLKPDEPVQKLGRDWLAPCFTLPRERESPEIQQERAAVDRLVLAKYDVYRDLLQRDGRTLVSLLVARLNLATYFAKTPAEFDAAIRTLDGEFEAARRRGDLLPSARDQYYIDYLVALLREIDWSGRATGWSSWENRRHWPAESLLSLWEFLDQHSDPAVRLLSLFGRCPLQGAEGLAAARRLFDAVFDLPSESPVEDFLGHRLLLRARERLGPQEVAARFGAVLEDAERRRDASAFVRWSASVWVQMVTGSEHREYLGRTSCRVA
jgi:hypothetical protein